MNKKNSSSTAYQGNVVPLVRPVSATNSPLSSDLFVQEQSGWLLQLADRFDELTALPVGWDGYGGSPVAFSCAQFAANLIDRLYDSEIDAPQLVPGSDGTLQIEWHENNLDIEVDILAPYEVVATRHDLVTSETKELELSSDMTELAIWIAELKEDRASTNINRA